VDKVKTPDELIAAYEKFYSNEGKAIWKDLKPMFKAIRRELDKQQSLSGIGLRVKK
jgi:hypothetical protein